MKRTGRAVLFRFTLRNVHLGFFFSYLLLVYQFTESCNQDIKLAVGALVYKKV